MDVKELLASKLAEYFIKNKIATTGTCPAYVDIVNSQTAKIDEIFTPNSVPSVMYKSLSHIGKYKQTLDDIRMLMSSVAMSMSDIIAEHRRLSDTYQDICVRIDNEASIFRQMISSILSYSCFFVDTMPANQLPTSLTGKIGKYVTLPFFINGVQMYNDKIFIRPLSAGDVVFSNLESITALPFTDWPSMKIQSGTSTVDVTLNMTTNLITGNAIYIKFLNSVLDCTITLFNDATQVWSGTYHTEEIFANFLPVQFNMISVKLTATNSNASKPFAMQMRSLEIFQRIQFAKHGTFQSKALYLEEASRVSYVGTQYADVGNAQYTATQPLISVSTDETNMSYSMINLGDFINISYFKYKHSKPIINFDNVGRDTSSPDYVGLQNIGASQYYRIPIHKEEPMWNMNYRFASLFHGLNKEYASNSLSYYTMYENWTKVGNYYKTQLLNYEDGIFVDIGQKTCILNGKQVTGKVKIPIGVSLIEVHSKDIDFKFGNRISDSRFNGIVNKATVYSDDLFPFNFAYMFAGMPEYSDTSDAMLPITQRAFDITAATTIFLDEPFIPMSISVADKEGNQYDMQLTKGVSTPGTFSIEPNSGKIRVFPLAQTTVTVRYRKASLMRRPCGILFNRLLTFIPLKALMGLPDKDDTLFTIDGTPTERFLLLQKIQDVNIQHSYIMYNKFTDKIYSAVKLDMKTDNQYLSPIISDVYITTG